MDRNVFAMIAATVFLLTMILATIQMQIHMIEKAADEINTDFSAYAYPMAGSMYVLNHGPIAHDKKFGYMYNTELESKIEPTHGSGCIFKKVSGNPKPGFGEDQLLKLKHSIDSVDPDCGYATYTYTPAGSPYTTYGGTNTVPRSNIYGTSLEFTIMIKKDNGDDTEVNPKEIKVTQKAYNP